MSGVTIFQDVTTESVLLELEAESKTYTDLYVNMDIAEERKYVKDKASLINGMLKKLDRSRIDKTKEYKNKIEAEAAELEERLRDANHPFVSLIDAHTEKRKAILAAEKAALQLVEDAQQKEEDHDAAIMEDKVRTFEAAETLRLQKERDEQIALEGAKHERKKAELAAKQAELNAVAAQEKAEEELYRANLAAEEAVMNAERDAIEAHEIAEKEKRAAILAEQNKQAAEKQRVADEQAAREANKDHKREVNNAAKAGFMAGGFTEEQAIQAIKLIAKNLIQNVTINY